MRQYSIEPSERCPTCFQVIKPDRSRKAHNRLFWLCSAAFYFWPDSHHFSPQSPDHLRYWLITQTVWHDVVATTRVKSVEPEKLAAAIEAHLRSSTDLNRFTEIHGDMVITKRARTLKTRGPEAIKKSEFSALCDAVADVIYAEIGIPQDQLLEEYKAVA